MGKKTWVVLIIIISAIFLGASFNASSPEAAIRKHLFFTNPRQSLTCDIDQTSYVDKTYGRQYTVKGFIDPESGGEICFAYVKKDSLGLYYWSGGGSGP